MQNRNDTFFAISRSYPLYRRPNLGLPVSLNELSHFQAPPSSQLDERTSLRIIHRCTIPLDHHQNQHHYGATFESVDVDSHYDVRGLLSAVTIPRDLDGLLSAMVFAVSGDSCDGFALSGLETLSTSTAGRRSASAADPQLKLTNFSRSLTLGNTRPTLVACQETWTTTTSLLTTSLPAMSSRRLFVCVPHKVQSIVEFDLERLSNYGGDSLEAIDFPLRSLPFFEEGFESMLEGSFFRCTRPPKDLAATMCVNPFCATDQIVATGALGGHVQLFDSRVTLSEPVSRVDEIFGGSSASLRSLRFSDNGVTVLCGGGGGREAFPLHRNASSVATHDDTLGCVSLIDLRKVCKAATSSSRTTRSKRQRDGCVAGSNSAVVAQSVPVTLHPASTILEGVAAASHRGAADFISHIELNPAVPGTFVLVSSCGATTMTSVHEVWKRAQRGDRQMDKLGRTPTTAASHGTSDPSEATIVSSCFTGCDQPRPALVRGYPFRGRPLVTLSDDCNYLGPVVGVSFPQDKETIRTDYYRGETFVHSTFSDYLFANNEATPFFIPVSFPTLQKSSFAQMYRKKCYPIENTAETIDGCEVDLEKQKNALALCSYDQRGGEMKCWHATI